MASGFLGTGWSFPPSFDASTGAVRMVSDDDDIRQSLAILFSTLQNERIMQPQFGSALRQYVFDAAEPALYARIASALSKAILYNEARISVNAIDVTLADALAGRLSVSVTYTIRQTNTRSNMVYPFYLQGEGTNARRIG